MMTFVTAIIAWALFVVGFTTLAYETNRIVHVYPTRFAWEAHGRLAVISVVLAGWWVLIN